jgi:hypothetical protein
MGIKKLEPINPPAVASGVADALFSKVQQRVLAVLFGNHSRSFYANALLPPNAPRFSGFSEWKFPFRAPYLVDL